MDNAATSFPKPPEVLAAMVDYAQRIGASAGRGAYAEAQESGRVIRECRERLNQLFNGQDPNHFIFTLNCTDALNLAIQGILRPGDHAITTWLDHNSVLRPYDALCRQHGGEFTHVPLDKRECIADPQDIKKAIRKNTRLIAVVHGSNVTGSVQAVREIGKIAREAAVPFLVDAAQTAGHVPIDVQADCIDMLAAPGHKGLLGPLGTGFLYMRPGLEKLIRPLRYGGTGSVSEQSTQPEMMPDKYESGSHNAIGIAGLSAGLKYLLDRTVADLWAHDRALCKTFMSDLEGVDNLRYLGPQGIKNRMGVFSVQIDGIAPLALSRMLEDEYGILTRPGLHCAPLAHETIGTLSTGGTTRLSFGPFLQSFDVKYAADALCQIALRNHASPGVSVA